MQGEITFRPFTITEWPASRKSAMGEKYAVKKKIVIMLIIGVVLFALFGKSMFGSKESMIYETAQIERRDISSYVTAIGTVSAVTTRGSGTQVSGTIKEIYVDYNSTVKEDR